MTIHTLQNTNNNTPSRDPHLQHPPEEISWGTGTHTSHQHNGSRSRHHSERDTTSRRKHLIDYCFTRGGRHAKEGASTDSTETLHTPSLNADTLTSKKGDTSLSLRKIAINFNLLSKKLKVVSIVFTYVSNIINWERDDKTLTFLFLFTWSCLNLHFFLLYPIIYLIYHILCKYLIKHPIIEKPSMYIHKHKKCNNTPEADNYWDDGLGPRLKATSSNHIHGIFGFLWNEDVVDDDDEYREENINALIEELDFKDVDEMLTLIEETVGETCTTTTPLNEQVYNNFIMKTLYDIQTQTSQILDHLDNIELGISENCDFIDEKESTLLIFKLFLVVSIGCFLGSYIPWKFIIITATWIGICMNHPNRRKFFSNLLEDGDSAGLDATRAQKIACNTHSNETRACENTRANENTRVNEATASKSLFCEESVIINEPVFAREVEIFELQQQDIMKPREYLTVGFTNHLFNISEELRLQRRKPDYVDDLSRIEPPLRKDEDKSSKKKLQLYWDFISGEEWEMCDDLSWIDDMSCLPEFQVKAFEREGWVYDITGEFRRRRWVRRIVQRV